MSRRFEMNAEEVESTNSSLEIIAETRRLESLSLLSQTGPQPRLSPLLPRSPHWLPPRVTASGAPRHHVNPYIAASGTKNGPISPVGCAEGGREEGIPEIGVRGPPGSSRGSPANEEQVSFNLIQLDGNSPCYSSY